MNDVVTLSQLITRLAKATGTDLNTSRRFVRTFFAAIEDALIAGEEIQVKGIGTFRRNSDPTFGGESPVIFIADPELAKEINSPFAIFEPVELADEADFEPIAEADAPAPNEHERLSTSTPVETDNGSVPPAKEEPAAQTSPVTEEKPVQHEEHIPKYRFPEEEEEDDAQDSSLITPPSARKTNWWLWIALGLAGGALAGYLAANFDPLESSNGTDTDNAWQAPADTISAEKSIVAELGPTAEPEILPDESPSVTPASKPAEESVVTKEPQAQAEHYDTVGPKHYLATMARQNYGKSIYWVFIYQANAEKLGHPDRIAPGTRVRIPDKSEFAEPTEAATQHKAEQIKADLDRKYK